MATFFSGWDLNFLLNDPNFVPGLLLILVLVLLSVLFFLLRALFQAQNFISTSLKQVVFLVTVPREAAGNEDAKEGIEAIRGQIAIAESWFATLGGLKAQRGFWAWFAGRTDHFSLEIVFREGLIHFYIGVPEYLHDYMEHQILAQYPDADMQEVQDYNIFSPQGEIAGCYLKFTRSFLFPLKTYKTQDTDPLNSLTNSLSKIEKNDGAAIQIIARSAHKRWHRPGMRIGVEMNKGKTLTEAINLSKTFSFYKIMRFFEVKSQEQKDQTRYKQPRQLTPMEQELIKGIENKTSKAGLDCNLRVITSAANKEKATFYLEAIANSFSQYNYYQYGNSLRMFKDSSARFINDFIHRNYREKQKAILNTEELATIYHFPTPFLETQNIKWLLARKMAPPANLPAEGLLIGENNYRGAKTQIFIKNDDRRRHLYMIGMTGTGKSTLMANLAIQDIQQGKGVCVIDPHGSLVEDILPAIPKERIEDVIYFNPSDTDRPIGLNMLEALTPEQQDFAIQEMISIFYKLVTDPSMIGPMFEHNMRNAMLTLMADTEHPGTIAEIPRIFTDKEFQKYKVSKVTDPMVRSFWEQEMAKTSDFHKSEMLGYLISKVGRFVENAMIRNIIGQPQSGFNFRDVMDNQKILLVNLAKGTTGEVNSNLLGLILVAKLQMAALTRTDIAEGDRKDFYLYIDEFQNFITDSVATIMAEARKYKLNLILAHQYIGQLTEGSGPEGKSLGSKIKDSIFGNVGTIISYRIGAEDAEYIAKQMEPAVSEYDLMNIERYNAYIRLLVDNQPARPFNFKAYPPIKGRAGIAKDIKEYSRWKYGTDKRKAEAYIVEQSRLGQPTATNVTAPIERTL
ncbi:MAG: type IV secretion system DNA-binding domain-containing protein [Candidatus Buchananbacteria bacterium]